MSAPRLAHFDYTGYYAYSITICCAENQNIFITNDVYNMCLEHLKEIMAKHKFDLYTYCFMPNHTHLLLVGKSESSDMKEAIRIFKQKSGYYYRRGAKNVLWQKSFYDHVLRDDEDINRVARYILDNPVRAGLVKNYWEYPYSGSFVFDIKDFIVDEK